MASGVKIMFLVRSNTILKAYFLKMKKKMKKPLQYNLVSFMQNAVKIPELCAFLFLLSVCLVFFFLGLVFCFPLVLGGGGGGEVGGVQRKDQETVKLLKSLI